MSFRRMRHVKAREFQGCDIAYDFSNPATLYDATSGGSLVAADGAIARANDVSGGSNHMTQSNSTYQPLRKVAALNGMDVARFDGSNDYLTAGDVADMGTSPLELFAVVKHSANINGVWIFTKSTPTGSVGEWSLSCYAGTERAYYFTPGNQIVLAGSTEVTTLQLLHGSAPRTAGTNASVVTFLRNGKVIATSSGYTDSQASLNSTPSVLIGSMAGRSEFINGDMGEAAKYSATFTTAQRLRLNLSRCRKWRIAS